MTPINKEMPQQILRKKKVHRILWLGLFDQANEHHYKTFGGYDYEMGNTKLYRPAFRF